MGLQCLAERSNLIVIYPNGKQKRSRTCNTVSELITIKIYFENRKILTFLFFFFKFFLLEVFYTASVFNSDLSKLQTGAVTDMGDAFKWALKFNSDVSFWDTGRVTNMNKMFFNAPVFNSDLSMWNTNAVGNMESSN